MNIFQIFLCDDEWLPWNLTNCSQIFENKKQKILEMYPDGNYQLYTNDTIKDFLFEFNREVFDCFTSLKPYAFRADLARYCLLYQFGGWYFDISVTPLFKFETNKSTLLFFNKNKKIIENSIFYCQPKHSLMMSSINLSVTKIKNKSYGENPLDITGPQILTTAFDSLDRTVKKNIHYGSYTYKNYNDEASERWYEIDNLKFAEYKKYEYISRIDQIGFAGTNRYVDLWRTQNVYN